MEERKCQCGGRAAANASFCPYCGRNLGAEAVQEAAAQPVSAAEAQPVPPPAPPAKGHEGEQVVVERRCSACQALWDRLFKFCPECGTPAAGGQAGLKLVIHRTDGGCEEMLLSAAMVIVGSGHEATLQLSDSYVSKKHCRLTLDSGGQYRLEDLGSSNGTFIKLAGPRVLAPGDEFLVGGSLISLEKR